MNFNEYHRTQITNSYLLNPNLGELYRDSFWDGVGSNGSGGGKTTRSLKLVWIMLET